MAVLLRITDFMVSTQGSEVRDSSAVECSRNMLDDLRPGTVDKVLGTSGGWLGKEAESTLLRFSGSLCHLRCGKVQGLDNLALAGTEFRIALASGASRAPRGAAFVCAWGRRSMRVGFGGDVRDLGRNLLRENIYPFLTIQTHDIEGSWQF